ncbi:hypothetical protein BBD39_05580 [Arsenophonus endosymbiont of Bemisia tabaci Asia II 3]|nr:hypothetical protein BBD39_05580 [Arsenophonus endosymbiont of Bemisia tabaci Asia II 3]
MNTDTVLKFHCHNLIHEDHEMMAAFNVTALADLGYDEKTRFIDPMEPRYRAKSFPDADLRARTNDFSDASIQAKVEFFQSLEAYKNVDAVESRLSAYWATKATTLVTSTRSGNSGGATTTSSTRATTTVSTPRFAF